MAEKCSSCEQMIKENKSCRKAMLDTNKEYVAVVNENLALKRELEATRFIAFPSPRSTPSLKLKDSESAFYGMPLCAHGYQFDCQSCHYEKEKERND